MTLPNKPTRQFSFQGHSATLPTTPQPGVNIDAEVDRSNTAISGLIDHVSVTLAADGTLKGNSVTKDDLHPETLSFLQVQVRDYATPFAVAEARDWAEKLDGPVDDGLYSSKFWAVSTANTVSNFNQNAEAMFQAAAQEVIDETNAARDTATGAATTATNAATTATNAASSADADRLVIEPLVEDATLAAAEATSLVNQLVNLVYDFGTIGGDTGPTEDWGVLA